MSEGIIGPCPSCGKCMTACECRAPDTKAPAREWTIPAGTGSYYDGKEVHFAVGPLLDLTTELNVRVIEFSAFEEMRRERDEAVEMADLRAKQVKLELERIADFKRANAELRASLLESQSYQDELNKREILMKDSLKEAYAALGDAEAAFHSDYCGTSGHHALCLNNSRALENLFKRHEWLGDK